MIDFELFIIKNKLKKKDIAEFLGVSAAFITQLAQGIREVPDDKLALIKANKDWDTSMFGENPGKNLEAQKVEPDKMIPFYDAQAAAGYYYEMDMSAVTRPSKMIRMGDFLNDSEAAIQVFGNSMTPNYPAGCIVGTKVHTDSFIEPGTVYVIETRDNRYLKRLYYCEGEDCFECVSDNHMLCDEGSRKGKPCYPAFKIPFNEVVRLHRVTGVIKRNIL